MGGGTQHRSEGERSGSRCCSPTTITCRELTLQKGDIVYIHKEVDKNWLEGEHHGRLGIFPANYVEVSRRGGVSLLGGATGWETLKLQTSGFF